MVEHSEYNEFILAHRINNNELMCARCDCWPRHGPGFMWQGFQAPSPPDDKAKRSLNEVIEYLMAVNIR